MSGGSMHDSSLAGCESASIVALVCKSCATSRPKQAETGRRLPMEIASDRRRRVPHHGTNKSLPDNWLAGLVCILCGKGGFKARAHGVNLHVRIALLSHPD